MDEKMITELQNQSVAKDAEIERLKGAIAKAYGYLWCVNCEPATHRQYPPERAAYAARRALRDLLTKEQRGSAINAAVQEVHETVRAEWSRWFEMRRSGNHGEDTARPVDCRVRGEKSALAGRQEKGQE